MKEGQEPSPLLTEPTRIWRDNGEWKEGREQGQEACRNGHGMAHKVGASLSDYRPPARAASMKSKVGDQLLGKLMRLTRRKENKYNNKTSFKIGFDTLFGRVTSSWFPPDGFPIVACMESKGGGLASNYLSSTNSTAACVAWNDRHHAVEDPRGVLPGSYGK